MLLLSRELNASISNASYIDKVKEYKALNVIDISINELSYSSINNQIDWSETLIMGRTSHLALKFSSLLKKRNF